MSSNRGVRLTAENVGGIDSTTQEFDPGVTILSGENATNRTSLLQAIIAGLGGYRATLKGDREEGHVELVLDGERYTRTLSRADGTVRFDGAPYMEDPEVADLFAFLLRDSEARQAGVRGENLREVVMQPVDTDEIERQISELTRRRREIEAELEQIESRRADLSGLQRRAETLREQIDEKRAELAEIEDQIESSDHPADPDSERKERLQAQLDELKDTRSELESVRRQITEEQSSIASLEDELADLRADHQDLPGDPEAEDRSLDSRIDELRSRRQSLSEEVSSLQEVIEYNETLLEEDRTELRALAGPDASTGTSAADLTGRLVSDESDSVRCWTCGSTVDRAQIEDTLDRLRDLRQERAAALGDVRDELEDLKTEKRRAERIASRRTELRERIERTEAELDTRRERVETLKERRDALSATVQDLEDAVEDVDFGEFEETLSLHADANRVEVELDRLETELDDVVDQIEEVESLAERQRDLEAERADCDDEIADLRTRVERIEADVVEAFNDHMASVLDLLGYDNLERVWIERVERGRDTGGRSADATVFDLHVVRTTEEGTVYEDTIDHLSESEREVVGLTFALAGYLVHGLYEDVPFMLLDSLEAIDADRIAALVDYFGEYADYLVVALLEEDAAALDDAYPRIRDI